MRKVGASIVLAVNIALVVFVIFESFKEPVLICTAVAPIFIIIGACNVLRGKRSIFDLNKIAPAAKDEHLWG